MSSGLDNCRITITSPDGDSGQTHKVGCQAMNTMRRAGWTIARIFRAQPGEHPEAACCRPHEERRAA